MNTRSLQERARRLLSLHASDRTLVLPNVWDPFGARVVARAGFPAIATASAAISASLGYPDGERIDLDTHLAIVARIVAAVDVPVTADVESGYAETPAGVGETIRRVLEVGAVGVNLEDSIVEGGDRRDTTSQCERIAAAREAADRAGVPLVVNARIDSFLSLDPVEALDDAILRARAYRAAGADCVYPVGPGDETTVRALRRSIEGPINILASPACVPLDVLGSIGVNRVSFGPYLFRSCARRLVDIVRTIAETGDPACTSPVLPRDAIAPYLIDGGR